MRNSDAAGVLLTDTKGRVLLVEPSYKAYWDLPGGIIEEGESPRQALLDRPGALGGAGPRHTYQDP